MEQTLTDEREGLPSASNMRRYTLCAGSYQLELEAIRRGQVAHEDSPAAASGTRIHAWLAGEKVELSESELQTAQLLKERAEEQLTRIFGDASGVKIETEQRLWLEKRLSGKFDRLIYNEKLALVQDYKTGFREPDEAENNAQMRVLAVLVALNLPKSIEEVVVQIISGPFGVTEARFDMKQLEAIWFETVATLKAISDPEAKLNPSPEACRYCPAKLICPAIRDRVLTPFLRTDVAALPADGPRAALLLDQLEVVDKLIEEVRAFYKRQLEDPEVKIPGYALAPGASRREVTDWETARMRLGEYLDEDELSKASAGYRLPDLERALGKKLKLKLPEAKEKLGQVLNGLVVVKENTPSLKRTKTK